MGLPVLKFVAEGLVTGLCVEPAAERVAREGRRKKEDEHEYEVVWQQL